MGGAFCGGGTAVAGLAMKVLVTGASGFIGRHVVHALLEKGHEVLALGRVEGHVAQHPWFDKIRFIKHDIHLQELPDAALFGGVERMIHLAWPGLPNYKKLFHFEQNLPADYRFLKHMVSIGMRQIVVTGTCFEYGMRNGPLHTDLPPEPSNPYALAKDVLRCFLQQLQAEMPFVLKWARLFYMYGPGQNPNSVLAQLDAALKRGDSVFNMSGGEQLRDYLPVEAIAERLVGLAFSETASEIVNICSGKPISIRRLVEQHAAMRGKSIALNLGFYPYADYEAMAFWGVP